MVEILILIALYNSYKRIYKADEETALEHDLKRVFHKKGFEVDKITKSERKYIIEVK